MQLIRHAIAFVAIVNASVSVAAEFSARQTERAIEAEVAHVLSDRIAAKLYLVSAKVTEAPQASGDGNSAKKLPFAPLAFDQALVERSLRRTEDPALALESFAFAVELTFDASLKPETVEMYQAVVRKRLAIDDGKRSLTVKRATLYDESSEPSAKRAAAEALAAAERQQAAITRERAESERSRAQLETERARLELTKKELESVREKSQLEAKLQEAKDSLNRQIADLNGKVKAAQAGPVEGPPPTAMAIFQSVQPLVIGVLVVIGLVLAFLLTGGALRRGMASVAEGIKAIGDALGEGFRSQEKSKAKDRATTGKDAVEGSGAAVTQPPHWTDGVPNYEAFLDMVKDKLEILSRSRNFGFMRTFVDMIENDATAPLAAAALVALPEEAAGLLVSEISLRHVARIRATIEAPGGLARAKALRGAALQELYGRIAVDEFVNSPLSRLTNLGWLVRLSNAELADLAIEMDQGNRAAFMACLSPERVRKMLEGATDAARKEKLLQGLAGMGTVDAAKLQEFTKYASTLAPARQNTSGLGKVDPAAFVGEFVADLNPDDQQALLKSFASDPAVIARLRDQFVPFEAIVYAETDLVATLVDGLSDAEIAKALFASTEAVRAHVVAGLSRIRAEVVRGEINVLDGQSQSKEAHRRDSLALQKNIAKSLLKLVRGGIVRIPEDAKFSAASDGLSARAKATPGAA